MLIKRVPTYPFRWEVPARFNMAVTCCDRWAGDPERVALIHDQAGGVVRRYTFAELQGLSDRSVSDPKLRSRNLAPGAQA